MNDSRLTVVIVGAGFSGALTAAHLMRRNVGVPLRIVMLNRSGRMARGVAYGTRSSTHVLNVPAGRMSAFPSDENDFLRFARLRDPLIHSGSFVPRQLYGQYLEHVLLSAQAQAPRGTVLEQVADEAVSLDVVQGGSKAMVLLASGDRIPADRVVLALGNYAPSHPRIRDPHFYGSPRYTRDPWVIGALQSFEPTDPVVLIGTGLTMIDVALDLIERGHKGQLTAISRRGLLPRPHRPHTSPPPHIALAPELFAGAPSAVHYLRTVRRQIKQLSRQGIDWREVIGSLRPVTPRLWQALPTKERERFLHHVRPFWDVHRHRLAPELADSLQRMLVSKALTVRTGRIAAFREDAMGVDVDVMPRRSSTLETHRAARVINCTGPESDVRALSDPFLSYLILHGHVRPDDLGLGLEVTDELVLLDHEGEPNRVLSLVGPLLKGAYWEATAVPELRVHAQHVAERLATELQSERVRRSA